MWFIFDALGIFLGLLTWFLMLFADWVVTRHLLVTLFWSPEPRFPWLPYTDLGYVVFVVYQSILILSWLSHLRAMTADPGTVSDSEPPDGFQNPRTCKLCQGRWKPPRAHHCKTCRRCIFRMDHHCPWVNNCVGLANQKFFMLFLGYTALSAIMTLVLLVCSGVYWLLSQKSWSLAAQPGAIMMVCSGIVAVECLAAILFVGDFLQEQIESIQMNSTLVETYQQTHGERTNFWDHFRSIFGHSCWNWPWPYPSAPPPLYTEPVIPDDTDADILTHSLSYGDEDSLGIAGDDSEDCPIATHAAPYLEMDQGYTGLREGSAPRPRHRYFDGETPE